MNATYTTTGSIRGSCGHSHRTLDGAIRCLRRDRIICNQQGGYSDLRIVARENGERRELTECELDRIAEAVYR